MKKILILGILNFFIITIDTNASAIQTLKIASDSNVDWSANGITWQPSALCWVSSGWPIISDANWIWRTQFTDPIWEYDNVPSGG